MKDNWKLLPNVFLIGAAKSGTTSLSFSLASHPEVYLPFRKEPNFFGRDADFRKGIDWYIDTYYKVDKSFRIRVDASTHYLYWSTKVAPRIKSVYADKNVKFIAILRNPVHRAYSLYWHLVRDKIETLTFEEALKREDERLSRNGIEFEGRGDQIYGYFKGGCYASLLYPYLNLFSREQILLLLYEDLKNNLNKLLGDLFEFLEIDESTSLKKFSSNKATTTRSTMIHNFLTKPNKFKKVLKPYYDAIFPFKTRYMIRNWVFNKNLRQISYPKMKSETREFLTLRFLPEIKRLEDIMERDLSQWYDGQQ